MSTRTAWQPSLRAVSRSTSYEHYLELMAEAAAEVEASEVDWDSVERDEPYVDEDMFRGDR